jgi:hypothetical protein
MIKVQVLHKKLFPLIMDCLNFPRDTQVNVNPVAKAAAFTSWTEALQAGGLCVHSRILLLI